MKVIYDTDQPPEKRVEFVDNEGKSYFGFHCFQIQLDDGIELAKIGNWGNEKHRKAILEKFKTEGGRG